MAIRAAISWDVVYHEERHRKHAFKEPQVENRGFASGGSSVRSQAFAAGVKLFGAGLVALAELSIEEGHAADAQGPLREALETFRQQQLRDDELDAHLLLARTLVALGRRTEAENEIYVATDLVAKSQNRAAHLDFSLESARIHAASGKLADLIEAAKTVHFALAEATKYSFAGYQLEARLSLGEMEVKSGDVAAGRARLQALEKDAMAKGFLLIARKAAAELGQQPQT